MLILGVVLLLVAVAAPAPSGLVAALSAPRSATAATDPLASYPSYASLAVGESIAQYRAKLALSEVGGSVDPRDATWSAKAMLGILALAAPYWATRALPVSVTGMIVAFLLYAFGIFTPTRVASAFAAEPVLLLASTTAVAAAAATSGLDRRFGLAVAASTRAPVMFALIGLPALALVSPLLPGWAIVAFAVPALVGVHRELASKLRAPPARPMILGCTLAVCFAANVGAFGSPAGTRRNAALLVMLGDVQHGFGFAQWVARALPPLLAAAWVVGLYWLVVLRPPQAARHEAREAREHSVRAGPWSRGEAVTAGVLACMVVLWIGQAFWAPLRAWGLAGPALAGVVALVVLRVIDAKALSNVPWATVVSFAAACAVAKGLAATGAATWLGGTVAHLLPTSLSPAVALPIALLPAGALAATLLGDVAAVVLVGPFAIAASVQLGVDPAQTALAVAASVALANSLAIATPSNAVASALAKDAATGASLIGKRDFLVHGTAVTVLSVAMLSLWAWVRGGGWAAW